MNERSASADARTRDLDQTRQGLSQWFSKKMPAAKDLQLTEMVRPTSSGFSNDTFICHLEWREDGKSHSRKVVIRTEPQGYPVFPFYDAIRQFKVMKSLRKHSEVPLPECLWADEDKSVLGDRFFAMNYLEGEVPSDNPPYPIEGFVKDATPEQRETLWWNGLKALAQVHGVDWRSAELDFLAWPDNDSSPIQQHLDYYEAYFNWAKQGREQPVSDYTLQWLKDNIPKDEPEGIIWGDSRVGNQMFRDFKVIGVFDWEMVAIGNPLTDFGWWLFVDKVTMNGNGVTHNVAPRLEGLPSHEESTREYERLTGIATKHLHYYQVFAGFRFACVMIRIMQQRHFIGELPTEYLQAAECDNVVTQLLSKELDLPPPAEMGPGLPT